MRGVWDRYVAAAKIRDGVAAAACVSDATLTDYDRVRLLALHATPAALRAQSLLTRVRVLMLRTLYRAGHLAAIDGRQLFAVTVEAGWTELEAAATSTLRNFEVGAGGGRARYVSGQHGAGPWLGFLPVDGDWRIAMNDLLPPAEAAYRHMLRRSKLDEDAFVLHMVGAALERAVDESLWAPLLAE